MTRLLYNSADHLLSARHRQYAEPRPPNPQAPKPHHPHDAMAQHESHVEKSHMPHEVSAVTARRLSKPFEGSLPLSPNPRERASATTRDEFRARTPPSTIESSLVGFASIADALRPGSPPRARAVVREREATTLTRQPRFEIPTGSPRLHVARGIHRQEPHPEGDHQALQVHRTGSQERHVPPRHHRVQGLDPRQERGLEDPRSREPGQNHEGVPRERHSRQASLRRRRGGRRRARETPSSSRSSPSRAKISSRRANRPRRARARSNSRRGSSSRWTPSRTR